jgi:hypothetical protein
LDGSFRVDGIPPGDYLAIAELPGYLQLSLASADAMDEKAFEKLEAELPSVQVTADLTSDVNLTLRRGGSIAGRVRFDDGAPAAGVQVGLREMEANGTISRYSRSFASPQTSDDGSFRLAGLPPGKYWVQASFNFSGTQRTFSNGNGSSTYSGSPGSGLAVYAPDTLHPAKARVVEIKSDEQVGNVDIEVPLSRLHRVQGRAVRREDGHPLFGGRVILSDDEDDEFQRGATLQADGRWSIDLVPAGMYTLRASGLLDDPGNGPATAEKLKGYFAGTAKVVVVDDDVVTDDLLLDAATPTAYF